MIMKKLSAFMLLSCVSLLTACSQITILNPKSTTGKEQAYLIWFSLAIMLIVLIVVFILFVWFVLKYRHTKNRPEHVATEDTGNKTLELTYTIIPIILLIILAIPTVNITLDQSPSTEAAKDQNGTKVEVTAKQFAWDFKHANGKKEINELVIPEGEPIVLKLKSADVVHSFWVPELAGKVDTYPNKTLTYVIKNPEKGTYQGKCAEFCGTNHADMTFEVKVVSKENYQKYLEQS